MITGTYNVPATLASQPILQELYLECDTSAPVTINLFEIADVQRQWDLVIYVSDATNNAGLFPITINCGAGNHFDQLGVNTLTLNVDGSAVELRIVSDTAWLASKGSSSSGGGGITDVSYSQLYNLITTKGLTKGAKYRLIDYRSVNFLNGYRTAENNPTPTTPFFNPREVYTSSTEQFILTAISDYELSPIAISETYNGDILEYQAYTNKIGLKLLLANGYILPDSSVVSGFDLQYDALTSEVYFNMPTGYLALYGQFMSIYADFNDGINPPYNLSVTTLSLNPFVTNDVINYGDVSSIIKTDDQIKVVLPNLTLSDFNNYQANSLQVETIYALEDAFGYVTQRTDTNLNISVPFDFRNYKYRRFGVDLSAINPYISTGFYGIGDNFLGQGTLGTFQDFSVFSATASNINWRGFSSIVGEYSSMDNLVVFGKCELLELNNSYLYDNTFEGLGQVTALNVSIITNVCAQSVTNTLIQSNFTDNVFNSINSAKLNEFSTNIFEGLTNTEIGYACKGNQFQNITNCIILNGFQGNVIESMNNCQIGNDFSDNDSSVGFDDNVVGNYFQNNQLTNSCSNNTFGNNFNQNTVNNVFDNNIVGNDFLRNTIEGVFVNNYIGRRFQDNQIGNSFISNVFGDDSSFNTTGSVANCRFGNNTSNNDFGVSFTLNVAGNNFYNNVFVGGSNSQNNFGDDFHDNTMDLFFFRNTFTRNTYLNTFGQVFAQNNFLESCFSNVFGSAFTTNTMCNRCENNTIGTGFTSNTANDTFVENTLGDGCRGNEFEEDFNNCTTVGDFSNNKVDTGLNGIDFSTATLVYQNGNKIIFRRSDNSTQLSYVDPTNTVIYAAITA